MDLPKAPVRSGMSKQEAECYAIVEAIRQKEFGMGLVLNAEGGRLRERQNERMGRALHKLSQVGSHMRNWLICIVKYCEIWEDG